MANNSVAPAEQDVFPIELEPIYELGFADYLNFRAEYTGISHEYADPRYTDAIRDGVKFVVDSHLDRVLDANRAVAIGAIIGSELYVSKPEVREELGLTPDDISDEVSAPHEADLAAFWLIDRIRSSSDLSQLVSIGLNQPQRSSLFDIVHGALFEQLPDEILPSALAAVLHLEATEIFKRYQDVPSHAYGHFSADKYRGLLGDTVSETDPILARQEADEWRAVSGIDMADRTVIDIGAGEGRVTLPLADRAKHIIAIENNPDMLVALQADCADKPNIEPVLGDITDLPAVLSDHKLVRPIQLLLQNTLGTIDGNSQAVLDGMHEIFADSGGDVVITLFRSEALHTWGFNLYQRIGSMVGQLNPLHTGHEGMFVSSTGYISKWRNREEIDTIEKQFMDNDVITNRIVTDEYVILHFTR